MAVILTEELKREIGQHFVFGFHGQEVGEDIKTLIKDYHLGNIILMKRNVRDAKQVCKITKELQTIARESGHKQPLLIGIDQENGLVSAFSSESAGTQFPGAMALAAIGSPPLAEEVSAACAKELKMVGINWVYSPVADVNSDSRNPVIGVRSFGDNPESVAVYASAVSRGLTSGGVAPSAKHFPGHGDTHIDSHLALPRISKTKDELERIELVPFKALAKSDPVASIMVGHMALPLLTGDDTPASLSKHVILGLIREDMKYDGVVVTDCLEMDAIADPAQGGCGVEEGAVRALSSGVDVVMACHTFSRHVGAVRRVYEELETGGLNLEDLRKSGRRVETMKQRFAGSWEDILNHEDQEAFEEKWNVVKNANLSLSVEAYRKSCAAIWGSENLPLRVDQSQQVLLFTPQAEAINRAVDDTDGVLRDRAGRLRNTAGASYLALAGMVQQRTRSKHIVYSPQDTETNLDAPPDVGAVIFVLRNADRSSWQKKYLRKVLAEYSGIPVVLLASCGPYDLVGEADIASGTIYLASFEFTRHAFDAFVEAVFDDRHEPWASLPVSNVAHD